MHKKKFLNSDLKKKIVLVDRQRVAQTVLSSIIVSAFGKKKNLETIIIKQKSHNSFNLLFKGLGFSKIFIVSSFLDYIINFNYTIISFAKTINAILYINKFGFIHFINNFKEKNVLLGDLIYDSYIRREKKFLNPKIDIRLIRIIFFSLHKFLKIEYFFKSNNIKYLFITTDCFANNESISARIALKEKIPVYKFFFPKEKIFIFPYLKLEILNGFMSINNFLNLKKLKKTVILNKKKLYNFYKNRLIGKTFTQYTGKNDLINANKIKKNFSKKDLIIKIFKNEKKFKKIILIAPHAFSDAPHHFGKFIFRDYFHQFTETLKFIKKTNNKNILWLIRPHPTSKLYGEENMLKKFVQQMPFNVKFCDNNLASTKNLIKICDTVITGRGTIGLEFACNGKRPIIAGAATYSKFGLAIECNSQKKYFHSLKNIYKIKRLDPRKKNLARKLLYYIDKIFPYNVKNNLNQLIFKSKSKTFFDFFSMLSDHNPKKISSKIIKEINNKNFNKNELYKFYFKNANLV